jgi:hypothetical protein
MNNPVRIPAKQEELRILRDALEALHRTAGLEAEIDTLEPRAVHDTYEPDAHIVVRHEGRRYVYVVEVKRTVDRREALNHVKHQLRLIKVPALLATAYITADLAKYCRDVLDLQFIDTAGNAYLHARGLYIYIRGEREPVFDTTTTARRGGGTNTALRVIFALLTKPELLNAPYREITAAAAVALGAVGWVFFDLQNRRLLAGKKGNRRLLNRERLLEEFATNYPIKLRPRLVAPLRFRGPTPEWWQTAVMDRHQAVWGGEVAGDRLTNNREPAHFTVYLPGDPAKFILENRLHADPAGNIEFVRRFWQFDLDPPYPTDVAPPLLVYADLMATPDPRNHDTAKQVHDRYLANAPHKT